MTLDLMSEQTMTPEDMAALCARAYTHSRPWVAHDFADSLDSPPALVAATSHAFVFGLVGLVIGILSDLMYVFVDPRIDFEKREA